ncbi:ATP-dependent nuclease [Pollutimonas thiosulfatoxidans]|uniref:ATP-dependent nuclease n=1 Tax=Pollutimonas thiosulfatoxidans TaxID=2028345 RepID=UPI0018F03E6C|nr:AAA family ATPase [Pollutimonas thiosulfatoxidans]
MRIESITLSGFRCFGPNPITVPISPNITAVVGPNAAGKTALLQALSKMFGVSRAQRTVQRSDFHLGVKDDPDDREAKDLFIDVLIGLPELADGTATPETIAPSFRHMQIERADESPVCRLRLEARWEDDGTVEGEVSQELFWIDTLEDDPSEDKRHPVSAVDRGLIQLYYTPASRDATAQIRATTGALAARLLRAIEWSSSAQEAVQEASESLATAFEGSQRLLRSAKPYRRAGQAFTMMSSIRNPGLAWSVADSKRSSTRLPSFLSKGRTVTNVSSTL